MNYYFELPKKPKHLWFKLKRKLQETLEIKMIKTTETLFSFEKPLNGEENGKSI